MSELICDGEEDCPRCEGVGKVYDSTGFLAPKPCPECKPNESIQE